MFKTKDDIRNWLNDMNVKNYTINEDLTVDVCDNVEITDKTLELLPIQFGRVDGIFKCSNLLLKNLKGCPKYVEHSFFCEHNKLTSLEGAPLEVGWHFYCHDNLLKNLYGLIDSNIGRSISAYNNPINTLEYLPKSLGQLLNISHQSIAIEGFENFYEYIQPSINKLSLSLNEIKSIYLEHKLNNALAPNNINNKKLKV